VKQEAMFFSVKRTSLHCRKWRAATGRQARPTLSSLHKTPLVRQSIGLLDCCHLHSVGLDGMARVRSVYRM